MGSERLQELLAGELRELYDAELQLVRALPKMARAAESDQLRRAFNEHLEATRRQAERLEKAFELLGENAKSRPCKGMRGIIEEGEEHIDERLEDESIDSVLVGGGGKVEHYEIAAYTSAHELAESRLSQISGRLLKTMVRQAA